MLQQVLFVGRRMSFVITTYFFGGFTSFQLQLLIIQSVLMMIYTAEVKPFSSNLTNQLELFNEVSILCICYQLFIFTDFVDNPELQYAMGWLIIFITVLNLGLNSLIILFLTGRDIKNSINRLCKKIKRRSQVASTRVISLQNNSNISFSTEVQLNTLRPRVGLQTSIPRGIEDEFFPPRATHKGQLTGKVYPFVDRTE